MKSRQLLGIVLTISAAMATVLPTQVVSAGSPGRQADAQRFRAEVGFRSDSTYVARTFIDRARFSDVSWGLPLSQAEADDLAERLDDNEATLPAMEYAATLPGYAGAYFDQQDAGTAVFLFTRDLDERREDLASRIPAGIAWDVRRVDRSMDELQTAHARIVERFNDYLVSGVLTTTVGFDIPGNRIRVGVEDRVSTARDLLREFGEAVSVSQRGVPLMDDCTGIDQCPKAKGGLEITNNNRCTVGYMVWRDDGDYAAAVTAGHCFALKTASDSTWAHDGDAFGTQVARMWSNQRPDPGDPWPAPLTTDVGLLDISGGMTPTDFNDLLYKDVNPGTIANVTSHATSILQHPTGTLICRFGAGSAPDPDFSARRCGTVFSWADTNFSCEGPGNAGQCARIALTMEASFDSTGGDSGGPIWYGNSSTDGPMKAMGLHVHSDADSNQGDTDPDKHGWYTPMSQVIDGLDEKGVDIHVCHDANC